MKTCVICQTYFHYVGRHNRQTCSYACSVRLRVENTPGLPQRYDQSFRDALRSLWDEGLSARLIAARLGVTKNSIIGMAHRMHLPGRPSPIPAAPRQPRQLKVVLPPAIPGRLNVSQIASLGRKPPKPAPRPYEPPRLPVCDVRTCQWPFGEPRSKSFRFCGEKTVLGMPYCEAHCRVAYPHWRRAAA